jgi:hypothetical protein
LSSLTTPALEQSKISNVSSWLTPQPAREILLEREARLARPSLKGFIQATKPDYRFGWFNELLCAKLDQFLTDVLAQRGPRLMVFAPPRHRLVVIPKLCLVAS